MNRNPALRQQSLKGELANASQTARLRQRQPLLLEQRECKLLLQFGLGDMSCLQHLIWNSDRHLYSSILYRREIVRTGKPQNPGTYVANPSLFLGFSVGDRLLEGRAYADKPA